jgi:hypothetical protein
MSPSVNSTNKPAWVQLYEARRLTMEVEARSPGRPPAPVPRRKVGTTLSQGEISELDEWQKLFSKQLMRKVSTGETIGILTRICTARLSRFPAMSEATTLAELVDWMVGQE